MTEASKRERDRAEAEERRKARELLEINKAKLKDDTVTFLRVNHNGTFRQKALMMMAHARKTFYAEEDQDGRIYKENRERAKGKPIFDALRVNPHRVQLYSINEIWSCVARRLFELGIMQNPDEES